MAITQADLLLLNIAYRGTPFVFVAPSTIDTLELDTAWRGTPFIGVQPAVIPPAPDAPATGGSGGKVRRGRRSHGFIGLSDIAAPSTPLIKIAGRMSAREEPDTFFATGSAYESPEQIRAARNARTIALLMME